MPGTFLLRSDTSGIDLLGDACRGMGYQLDISRLSKVILQPS